MPSSAGAVLVPAETDGVEESSDKDATFTPELLEETLGLELTAAAEDDDL